MEDETTRHLAVTEVELRGLIREGIYEVRTYSDGVFDSDTIDDAVEFIVKGLRDRGVCVEGQCRRLDRGSRG